MAFFDFLFGRKKDRIPSVRPGARARFDADELARRLGVDAARLRVIQPAYHEFSVPKRSGGSRRILAPTPELKHIQRLILRRLLRKLVSHPAATGFERGHSIVTHARRHSGQAVVIHLDIRRFFESTQAERVHAFFRHCGWDEESARIVTHLTTHDGGLPQGAPTSPRLSNLVNFALDRRLDALAAQCRAVYSRYADDMTFSLAHDDPATVKMILLNAGRIAADLGYRLNPRKLRVRRRHQQQRVTGLIVNERPALPRETRRRLRAIEHHLRTNRRATMSEPQLAGWRSLQAMIESQRDHSG